MIMDFNGTIPVTFVAALIDAGYGEFISLIDKEYSDEELNNARNAYVKQKEDK